MKLHPSPITCFFIDEDNNLILVKSFNSTSCAITYEITLQNNKINRFYKTFNNTMYKGVAHNNVTYYSLLKVYTLVYITLMVESHLFLVNIHEPVTVF